MSDGRPEAPGEYLTFVLDGETYGVRLREVRSIVQYQPLTAVPNVPPCVRGVINLRGDVVAVVDLAAKFGLGATPVTKWTCLVVVEANLDGEATRLAIVADAVEDVLRFAAADVVAPPSFGARVRIEYLLGLGKTQDKFVLLLDLARILTVDELMTLGAAVRQSGAPGPEASA